MKRRALAAIEVLACAGAVFASPLLAGPVSAPRIRTRGGFSAPVVVAPLNAAVGSSVRSDGKLMTGKGVSGNLPGPMKFIPANRAWSEPGRQNLSPSFELPAGRVGFRGAAQPPALPASAIMPAAAINETPGQLDAAAQASAVHAIEMMSDSGLGDGVLRPGPGGELPVLRRQSLALAVKAQAVAAQMSAASGVASDESLQGMGRRVMDILAGERSVEGTALDARTDGTAARDVPSGFPTGRGVEFGALSPWVADQAAFGAGVLADSAFIGVLPRAVRRGAWLPGAGGDGLPSAGSLTQEGVSRIALHVYKESLYLYVVGGGLSSVALRWARDGASLVSRPWDGSSARPDEATGVEPRDAEAAPLEATGMAGVNRLFPAASYAAAPEAEAFSFLQSAGARARPDVFPGSGLQGGVGQEPARTPEPPRPMAPLAMAGLLPFLGLALVLRSGFFS
ncbi:MAG TPA: hypothetical protein DEB40_02085 [Elusimicrobia bacterium]|nr:hypothetical protein [Elusimicrobiota bacterium]HBT60520.1 hypothetical protein [Elusimicrobiota bacterium]